MAATEEIDLPAGREATAEGIASRRDQLDRIALRCAARPILDQRSADEICGYDANGLPC
jgi:hypothetical protein